MNPFKAYSALERSPALESAVLAPAAGLTARYGSDLVARALLGMTLLGKDSEAKEAAWRRTRNSKSYGTFKNIVTGLGAAAGAAYPMMKNYRKEHSLAGNASKYIDRDSFYKDNPDALVREEAQAFNNPPSAAPNYMPGQGFTSGRTINKFASDSPVVNTWSAFFKEADRKSGLSDLYDRLDKQASAGDIDDALMDAIAAHCWEGSIEKEAFYSPNGEQQQQAQYNFTQATIPVHMGRQLMQRDPFLNEHNKSQVDYIMRNAGEGDSGSISGFDIARTAVKAGIGLAAGIAFGKTMGNLFSMNTAQTQRLSNIGAVAGAVYNTGIFN